jgi:uncharacterized protein (TIGR02145 family)
LRKLTLFIVFIFITHNAFSQIGIGTLNPNASAKLDISSASKGFLLPKMSLLERNTIANPTAGLQVWCTDCATNGILQIFNGNLWVNSAGTVVTAITVPSAPSNALATVLGYTSASVSFSPSTNNGGSGISSYTVTSSPGGFSVTGSASPFIITGLSNGTSYTFSVVANNSLGASSAAVTIAVTTYAIDGNAVCDGTEFFEYSELTSSTGRVWMDRNLGAKRAATSSTDNYAYGCLYQWGRGNDGHASISWSASTTGAAVNGTSSSLSSSTSPTNALFITNASIPYDWLSTQNNTLWQYSTSNNNPCPSGYFVPTEAEFAAEVSAYSITNAATAFSNGPSGGFKLVTPGTRNETSGVLSNTGGTGSYWTQSTSSTSASSYSIGSNIASAIYSNRSNGLSVRCIKGATNLSSFSLITYPQNGNVLLQFSELTNATDYVYYYKLNSSSTWTVYADEVNTIAGVTIAGLSNGLVYDFKVKAIISNNSPIYSGIISAVPTLLSSDIAYHQNFVTGQSNAKGAGPQLTMTQPYNNKMLNSTYTGLISLIEPNTVTYLISPVSTESIASSSSNFITKSSREQNNGFDYKSIVSISNSSGATYSGLKKGTTPYTRGITSLVTAKSVCSSLGIPYLISAFSVLHGESHGGNAAAIYKGYLEEWQNDLENDSKKITGQTGTIPMFLNQLSSYPSGTYATPSVAIGQLAAAEANPTKIYIVTPNYIFDYSSDNCNYVHYNSSSQRRLGEYYGKAMKKVLVDGVAWKPLSPSTVSISSNVITVNFNVPVAPLQFDTIKVMSTANYGFEYFDATNSATITNVALASNGTSVLITLSNTPTGANKKIAYAYSTNTVCGNFGGGRYLAGSAKGNLRDSDITPALYTDNLPTNFGTQLNNWCVHFIKDIN